MACGLNFSGPRNCVRTQTQFRLPGDGTGSILWQWGCPISKFSGCCPWSYQELCVVVKYDCTMNTPRCAVGLKEKGTWLPTEPPRSRSWSENFDKLVSAALALNRSEKESGNLTIVYDYYLFYKCSDRQVVIQQKCRGTSWASTRYFVTGLDSTAALEEKVDDTRKRVC